MQSKGDNLEAPLAEPVLIGGCSRFCALIGAAGLTLTSAATFYTYVSIHEHMELVGKSAVSHISSAHCTAIVSILNGLALTRQDAEYGETTGERSLTSRFTTFGAINLTENKFLEYHSQNVPMGTAGRIVRSALSELATQNANRSTQPALKLSNKNACWQTYGLNSRSAKILLPDQQDNNQTLFLYGPWIRDGQKNYAFALVRLRDYIMEVSGHQHKDLKEGLALSDQGGMLQLGLFAKPYQIHNSSTQPHSDSHSLHGPADESDEGLTANKEIPFENQILTSNVTVNHKELDLTAKRSAALIFALGIVSTSALVLMARHSAVKARDLNNQLLKKSLTDGLTQIANRRAWDQTMALEQARKDRYNTVYGLVVVDLDGFKDINDSQGHQAGDEVLQQAAKQLLLQLRPTDLLARVGGDEFAILVYAPTTQGMEDVTNRLRLALDQSGVRASIGSALSHPDKTLEQTWEQADKNMYQTKSMARNAPMRRKESRVQE